MATGIRLPISQKKKLVEERKQLVSCFSSPSDHWVHKPAITFSSLACLASLKMSSRQMTREHCGEKRVVPEYRRPDILVVILLSHRLFPVQGEVVIVSKSQKGVIMSSTPWYFIHNRTTAVFRAVCCLSLLEAAGPIIATAIER